MGEDDPAQHIPPDSKEGPTTRTVTAAASVMRAATTAMDGHDITANFKIHHFTDQQISSTAVVAAQLEDELTPGRRLPRKEGCQLPRLHFLPDSWDDIKTLSYAQNADEQVDDCDEKGRSICLPQETRGAS